MNCAVPLHGFHCGVREERTRWKSLNFGGRTRHGFVDITDILGTGLDIERRFFEIHQRWCYLLEFCGSVRHPIRSPAPQFFVTPWSE